MADYLTQLNESQRRAVLHEKGPSMIIAGAGSGKTRVITYRIVHLLKKGVDPFNILALTFTNKAAREMRERIEQLVGTEARNLWMGTFHSVFARILRVEAPRLGYPSDFTIYDTTDSKNLIKDIIKQEGLDPKIYKPPVVYGRISLVKNSFITPRDYNEDPEMQSEDIASGKPRMGKIYELYSKRCFKAGAMDFDDLLLITYKLLNRFPDVLNKYQQKFKYILVDEYQDTNYVQYLIIKKLAAAHLNISVVGDDAQSIYAFRGANINNILNFENDYPDLKVYKLEQNYRSTQLIVNASSDVIKHNKYQLEKKLWTENKPGYKIKVFKAITDTEEGKAIAQSIFEEKMKNQRKNAEFAILYRTNAQSRSFEESLRRLSLDYQIIGGLSFYQRKEIKDLLAYFRLTLNPDDEEALKRVINYPPRGIGKTTLEKILVIANEKGISLWEVVSNIRDFNFNSRVINAVAQFVVMIKSFRAETGNKDAYEAGMYIAKSSGILKLLQEDQTFEGKSRRENVEQCLSGMKGFTDDDNQEDKSLSAFLQNVSLLTDADTKAVSEDKITLMTVHGAKGLEFPCIYVVGLEENLFPSQLSLNSREELEEERRLFYVALTRAKEKLYLSYATSRYRWGNLIYSEASRFIDEIDPKYIDYQVKQTEEQSKKVPGSPAFPPPPPRNVNNRKVPVHKPSTDFKPEDTSGLAPGMKVEHNRFGFGEVVSVEGKESNKKATIKFKDLGDKKILLKYAKMRILN